MDNIKDVEKKIQRIKEEISRDTVSNKSFNITNLSEQEVADIITNRSKSFYTKLDNIEDLYTRLFFIMAVKQLKDSNVKAVVFLKNGQELEITKDDRFWWLRMDKTNETRLVVESKNNIKAFPISSIVGVEIVG